MRMTGSRKRQRGMIWLTEAIVSAIVISILLVPAIQVLPELGLLQSGVPEDAALSSLATASENALRLTGTFPPCGATTGSAGTCSLPEGVLSNDLMQKGFSVSATATAVTFDPTGLSGSTAAGDFYRIEGTATSPTGRKQTFTTLVGKP